METSTQTAERVLYFHDKQAEQNLFNKAEAAARELNTVLEYFPFQSIADIPVPNKEWITKTLLEKDLKLAKLAKIHKLETLNYTVPQWLTDSASIYSHWHSVKGGFTQVMQYLKRVGDAYEVDTELLEKEFENSAAYRKYLTGEQLTRLDRCRRYIDLMKESGIRFPEDFIRLFKLHGNPFMKVVSGEYVPNKHYVLTGEVQQQAPMQVTDSDYLLNIVW